MLKLGNPVNASNHRDWQVDLAKLPYAEIQGNLARVRNVRNCVYVTEQDYIVDYYDKTYDLSRLRAVDFWLVPFKENAALAHTMLSFEFGPGVSPAGEPTPPEHVCVSAEVRLEKGEQYQALRGALRQYELMYVVGDERDLIRLRTQHRGVEVYLYPTRATPAQARALFVDMLERVNKLAVKPEFYDLVTNNCTTNILRHVNRVLPEAAPYSHKVLFPGLADEYAYELGLIDNTLPFAEVKRNARVTDLALAFANDVEFSNKIRLGRGSPPR